MARKIRAILWIGLAAGTLDITENLVFNHFRGISPWHVFQYIASGLIGMKSFQNGWSSVALGVAIHYAIALTWTGIFLFAALKFPTIKRRSLLSGLIYGCVVYLIMNFIVLPLSGVPHPPTAITIASRVNAVLALIFCIGLPISLLTRKVKNYGTQSRQR
jgi:uncharacterized membrane protein YagU involved in acid resistance